MAVQLVAPDEFTAWAGSVDPTVAAILLGAVSGTAVRLAAPVSDAWTDSTTVPLEVKAILLQVATRVVANPAGFGAETVGSSSFSDPKQRGVVFLDEEKQALLEAAGLVYDAAESTVAVSLRPYRETSWRR